MLYTIAETTYTPQGDGNIVRVIMGFLAIVLKHITPRKGTETAVVIDIHLAIARNNSHPARGRESHAALQVHNRYHETPTPRKGTVTCQSTILQVPFLRTTPTPQGDENSFTNPKVSSVVTK